MKKILALLVLSISVGAVAQEGERVLLNSKEVDVKSDRAILVRTSNTPDKVTVNFLVPMENSSCLEWRTQYNHRTCYRTQNNYADRQTNCRNVTRTIPGTPSTNNTPRGPRYNGTSGTSGTPPRIETIRVCDTVRVLVSSHSIPYDCSYNTTYCFQEGTDIRRESDKVKIKFKNLAPLGGTEEETFRFAARQRQQDGSNVVYDINILSTVGNKEYEVKSKGILGFDSYVIESK